ncbi:MAG: sigma factor-like helix-turn-helix DNA-binding protein [Eubacteriales bacterium]|nr:sigma factor-like helix-turn-helix DNA-binding protein [Eubacteriales bacterium]
MTDAAYEKKLKAYECVRKMHSEPLSKRDVTNLLYGYKAARASISLLRAQLREDADVLLYPDGKPIEADKVTGTPNPTAQELAMMARSEAAQRYYQDTLEILDESTRILDKLLLCVSKLAPAYRLVVMEVMINQKTIEEVSAQMELSPATIKSYKSRAIDLIVEKINSRN